MSRRITAGALVLGLTTMMALLVATTNRTPSTARADGLDSRSLGGDELARSLGLTLITEWPVNGCNVGAESSEGVAYCLDEVTSDRNQAMLLALRIAGHDETDIQIYELERKLDETTGDDKQADIERNELIDQILELRARD